MLWKVVGRTVQSILGIGGLAMQGIGLYFDFTQAAQTPQGPWGFSILAWGSILFVVFAISTIGQLWWHIRKYEELYEYALSFEGLRVRPIDNDLQIGLVFKNTIDKPLEYRVDINSLYIEFGGNRPVNPKYSITGGVLPIGGSDQFKCAPLKMPQQFPCKGKLSYELVYGPPRKMKFQQKKEMEFDIAYMSGQIYLNPISNSQ